MLAYNNRIPIESRLVEIQSTKAFGSARSRVLQNDHVLLAMLLSRLPKRLPYLARQLATAAPKGQAGDISDVFTSMQEGSLTALPPRFAQLKKDLFKPEMMIDMWKEVLKELEVEAERVKRVGSEVRRPALSSTLGCRLRVGGYRESGLC
jgi:hypothetical protein